MVTQNERDILHELSEAATWYSGDTKLFSLVDSHQVAATHFRNKSGWNICLEYSVQGRVQISSLPIGPEAFAIGDLAEQLDLYNQANTRRNRRFCG